MNVEILKIGGSILTETLAFNRAAEIVDEKLVKGTLPVCVVSAMKGVTDKIITSIDNCLKEPEYHPEDFVEELKREHLNILPGGIKEDELVKEFEKLLQVLNYIKSSGELTGSVHAYAVSRGENFTSRLLSCYLDSKNIENVCFYGEDLIITDDNSFEATVELSETRENLEKLLLPQIKNGLVPIIAGFSGRSKNGSITILGRGGTDDTAVSIGFGLGVKKVVKYVIEEGIMNIDPKFLKEVEDNNFYDYNLFKTLPKPRIVPYLSYVEASELLREERTKVVHYKVLDPLMKGNIELHINNYYNNDQGTVVSKVEEAFYEDNKPRPKAISYQRNLSGITFLPIQSLSPCEVYANVFSALAEEKVDVRYVSMSGYQISLLVPEEHHKKAMKRLSHLDIALEVFPMKGNKGTFSVVGSEMRGMKGFFSKITGVLASHGVNIEQATQPNSENIIRFGLADDDIPIAVAAVYDELFNGDQYK
jgi:aspartate kinase